MKIYHIPCLEDNYSYLIVDESTKEAAVVDPVEPEKILEAANSHGLTLKLVLTTHHHWDHAGGNEKIKELVPGIKVYGGSIDNVKGCTDKVENGDKVHLGADISILALHTPCHTKGHISYYVTGKEDEDPAVFTGDTLFIASCGKFFEGTAEQMYQSLCVTLGSLPKPTRVYCGHEVTRTIGDAYLKQLSFTLLDPNFPKFVSIPETFDRPLLTSEPHIWSKVIESSDKFIIFASYPFWELLAFDDITKITKENPQQGIEKRLCRAALEFAAKNGGRQYGELRELAEGPNRRTIHDDITIMVVFLDQRRWWQSWKRIPQMMSYIEMYSVKNLQFALTVEPDNLRIQQKLGWAQNQRQAGHPTIPSSIEEELETNPFMRVDLPVIQEKVGCKSPIQALGELRKLKDNWRG